MSLPVFFCRVDMGIVHTGVTPARHGIHSWETAETVTYDIFGVTQEKTLSMSLLGDLSRAVGRSPFWTAPECSVEEPEGIHWWNGARMTPNTDFLPRHLRSQRTSCSLGSPWRGNCDASRDADDFKSFRDGLVRGIAIKAKLTGHFLRQGGWDLFAQVFTESHCAGHQCWHLHDPTHPWHKEEMARFIGDPVKDVYVAIDAAMGRILAEVDDDTTVVFLAGHGMGPKYQAQFLLDQILLRLGSRKLRKLILSRSHFQLPLS